MSTTTDTRSRPWAVLATLGIGLFMTLLDTSIVSIALPDIIDGLGTSLDKAVWVYSIYVLAFSVLLITAGRLGDMFGPRRLYLCGLALFTIASAACGVSQGATELVVARAAQGVGAALLAPQLIAIISVVFSRSQWSAAFGATGAMAGVAVLVGPTLGGLVVTSLGWQAVFLINVPIGIAGVVLALRIVPDLRPGRRAKLHLGALALGTAGLLGIFFGLLEGQRYDWSWGICLAIGGGALCLAGFVAMQRGQADAERLVPVAIFAKPEFAAMTIVIAAMGFAMLGLFLPLTIHFQSVLGWSALKAGLTIAAMPLAASFTAALSTQLVDRFGRPHVLVAGLLAFGTGMAGVAACAGVDTSPLVYVPGLFVAGLGMGCVFAPLYGIAMGSVRPELSGLASGVLGAAQELGAVLAGAIVGGALLQSRLAAAQVDWAQREAPRLPAPAREQFIAAFHDASSAGLQVGGGRAGAASAGLDPHAATGEAGRIAGQVFRHAFVDAMRPTLVVPIAVLVLVAVAYVLFARSAIAAGRTPMDDPGAAPEGRSSNGGGPAPAPYKVLCTYLVRPDKVDEIRTLLRRHWPVLHERGFVTQEPARVYFGADASGPFFVEIMTWTDPDASARAYHDETVNAIWNDLYLFTESRGSRPAIEYPHVEVEPLSPDAAPPPSDDDANDPRATASGRETISFGRIGLWM